MAQQPAIEEFNRIILVLEDDIKESQKLWNNEPESQFARRTYIKAIFTDIEGHLFAFKQVTLSLERALVGYKLPTARDTYINLFTEAERMILREKKFELRGDEAKERDYFLKFEENIRFVFKVFQRAMHVNAAIPFNEDGWRRLIATQDIRNRITHPKSAAEFEISDQDINTALVGVQWYEKAVEVLMDKAATESRFASRFRLVSDPADLNRP